MVRWTSWLQGIGFIAAVWGAWIILDRPILMVARRPSSYSEAKGFPPKIQSCADNGADSFPELAVNRSIPQAGIFEDSKTFSRRLRVIWSSEDFQWKLQQPVAGGGEDQWLTVAKFWDVDGDFFPDEAELLISPGRLKDWDQSEISAQFSLFAHLVKDEGSWAWVARLDKKDWSTSGNCYAWANPIVAFVNWAVMMQQWNPSLALHPAVASKAPSSTENSR
jgi:hypothetical protein